MGLIGVLLIIVGIVGMVLGAMMSGDIGIACLIAAFTALFSGIGFLLATRRLRRKAGGIYVERSNFMHRKIWLLPVLVLLCCALSACSFSDGTDRESSVETEGVTLETPVVMEDETPDEAEAAAVAKEETDESPDAGEAAAVETPADTEDSEDSSAESDAPAAEEVAVADPHGFATGETWWDTVSYRCHMEIECLQDTATGELRYHVTIEWADSADVNNIWEICAGTYDEAQNAIVFSDCRRDRETWHDDGTVTVETIYTDGTGRLSLDENHLLYWQDDVAGMGDNCVFENAA